MAAYPQSVAYTRTFNAYLASDHVTAATGLTIVVTLSKAGGAYAAAGGAVTEISNGLYKIVLTTTDTNTVGDLAFRGAVATMDDVKFVDQVTDPIRGLGAPTAFPGVAAGSNGGLPLVGTQIPNATAGAINGLPILGANTASLSFTGITSAIIGNVTGNLSGAVGSVTGLTASNLDATVSSRLASGSYTAPDNTSITAIKTQTDKLTFHGSNIAADVKEVNDVTVNGAGTALSPWGP